MTEIINVNFDLRPQPATHQVVVSVSYQVRLSTFEFFWHEEVRLEAVE